MSARESVEVDDQGVERRRPATLHQRLEMDVRPDGGFTALCGVVVPAALVVPAGSPDRAAARRCGLCEVRGLEWVLRFTEWVDGLEDLWDLEDLSHDGETLYVDDLLDLLL